MWAGSRLPPKHDAPSCCQMQTTKIRNSLEIHSSRKCNQVCWDNGVFISHCLNFLFNLFMVMFEFWLPLTMQKVCKTVHRRTLRATSSQNSPGLNWFTKRNPSWAVDAVNLSYERFNKEFLGVSPFSTTRIQCSLPQKIASLQLAEQNHCSRTQYANKARSKHGDKAVVRSDSMTRQLSFKLNFSN